jgi:hypothetical protein
MNGSPGDRLQRLAEASEREARMREAAAEAPARRPGVQGWPGLVSACLLLATVLAGQAWHGHWQSVRLEEALRDTTRLAGTLAQVQATRGAASPDMGTLATLQPALVPSPVPGAAPEFRLDTPP